MLVVLWHYRLIHGQQSSAKRMVKKVKLFPGVGARCTILTRFIHPRVVLEDQHHRTTVQLIKTEQKTLFFHAVPYIINGLLFNIISDAEG